MFSLLRPRPAHGPLLVSQGAVIVCLTASQLQLFELSMGVHLSQSKGIAVKRSQIDKILGTERLRWRKQETWSGGRAGPEFAEKEGDVIELYTVPPPKGASLRLGKLGPESAKSFLGKGVVHRLDDRT